MEWTGRTPTDGTGQCASSGLLYDGQRRGKPRLYSGLGLGHQFENGRHLDFDSGLEARFAIGREVGRMRAGKRLSTLLCLRIFLRVDRAQFEHDAWNSREAIFGEIIARHNRTSDYDVRISHDLLQPFCETVGGWRIVVNRADTFNVLDQRLLRRARCFRFRHRDPLDRCQQMLAYLVLVRAYG